MSETKTAQSLASFIEKLLENPIRMQEMEYSTRDGIHRITLTPAWPGERRVILKVDEGKKVYEFSEMFSCMPQEVQQLRIELHLRRDYKPFMLPSYPSRPKNDD